MYIFRYIKSRGIIVHRCNNLKIFMCFYFNACDNTFYIFSIIKQWGKRSPTFFTHSISLIKDKNATLYHSSNQTRGMIVYSIFIRYNGGNYEVFWACIYCALKYIYILIHNIFGNMICYSCFACARLAYYSWI